MGHADAPPPWVETVIIEMKASQAYQAKVFDEFYETLPVPVWNAQRTWLVIGFGTNSRTGGPLGAVQSRPPQIACTVSYPGGTRHWSVDNAAERVWPNRKDVSVPSLPAVSTGTRMDRRREYYRALSDALQQGAFSGHAPANVSAACAAARATRQAFLPAPPFPNLLPIYAAPLHDMDGWIADHCAQP